MGEEALGLGIHTHSLARIYSMSPSPESGMSVMQLERYHTDNRIHSGSNDVEHQRVDVHRRQNRHFHNAVQQGNKQSFLLSEDTL